MEILTLSKPATMIALVSLSEQRRLVNQFENTYISSQPAAGRSVDQ